MGFADTFLVGGALFIVLPIVFGILVRLVGRHLPGWVAPAVAVGGAIAVALALSLWLDRAGVTTTGVVVRKDETLGGSRAGTYVHHVSMWVRLLPRGARDSVLTDLGADLADFDAVRTGGPVRVRYLPAHPTFARLADRTTASVIRGLIPPGGGWIAWFAGAVLAIVLSWVVLARFAAGRVVATGLTLALLAWGLVTMYTLRPAPPLGARVGTTVGRVATIGHVRDYNTGSRGGRYDRLAMPYELVGVRLLAPGRPDSVLGADAVDTGSIRGLRLGVLVPVTYALADPRRILITGVTRTFYAKDNISMVYGVVLLAALGVLWMLASAGMRRARAGVAARLARARAAGRGP